jgi:hypothetical protein
MTTVTISLPESLKTFVDKQVATKGANIFGRCSVRLRRRRRTQSWRPC